MLPLPIPPRLLMPSPSISLPGQSSPSSSCTYLYARPRIAAQTKFSPTFPSLATLRKSVGLSVLFFFLTITFMLLAIGKHGLLWGLQRRRR
jgi:hypothetical protein